MFRLDHVLSRSVHTPSFEARGGRNEVKKNTGTRLKIQTRSILKTRSKFGQDATRRFEGPVHRGECYYYYSFKLSTATFQHLPSTLIHGIYLSICCCCFPLGFPVVRGEAGQAQGHRPFFVVFYFLSFLSLSSLSAVYSPAYSWSIINITNKKLVD